MKIGLCLSFAVVTQFLRDFFSLHPHPQHLISTSLGDFMAPLSPFIRIDRLVLAICLARCLPEVRAFASSSPRSGSTGLMIRQSLSHQSALKSWLHRRTSPAASVLAQVTTPGGPRQSDAALYSHLRTNNNHLHSRRQGTRLFSVVPDARQADAVVDEQDHQNEFDAYHLTEELSSTSQPTYEIKSKPVDGGNWNPSDPLRWAKDFGRRSPEYEESLKEKTKLSPGDEGYFDVSDMKLPKVTIVRTKEQARIVMEKLMNADPSIFHACDTEVMDIDVKEVGPVGNGFVTCASVYSGPDFDYGLGEGPGSALWIDNLDDAHGILQEFKPFFEDRSKLKVWHNYGFDRHVMWNEGIDCIGFGGDTMHMARLQDTSRAKTYQGLGYSLEALTQELLGARKKPMKEIFGVPRLRKDGTEGSIVDIPPIEVLQRDPRFRANFIIYSCYDAEGTWRLHEKLKKMLQEMDWIVPGKNLYDYYFANMRAFGEVLTDMERRGVRVDAKQYLASVEVQARKDREEHSKTFREWAAKKIGPDGFAMNPASSLQLGTFLFGGARNAKTKESTEEIRVFKVPRDEIPEDVRASYRARIEKDEKKKRSKTPSSQDHF